MIKSRRFLIFKPQTIRSPIVCNDPKQRKRHKTWCKLFAFLFQKHSSHFTKYENRCYIRPTLGARLHSSTRVTTGLFVLRTAVNCLHHCHSAIVGLLHFNVGQCSTCVAVWAEAGVFHDYILTTLTTVCSSCHHSLLPAAAPITSLLLDQPECSGRLPVPSVRAFAKTTSLKSHQEK